MVATTRIDFIAAHGAATSSPGSSTTARAGAHFDNYPHERFLGTSPAKHPYKDTIVELDDIVGRLVAELEATGQLEDTLVFISSDNGPEMETWPDAAYSPFRCAKGSTWEGGQRVPGDRVVAGHDRRRTARRDGLFSLRWTCSPRSCALAGADDSMPDDRYIDGVDQTSFLLAPDGESNRKYLYYWLGQRVLGAACRRVEVHGRVDLRRRPRRARTSAGSPA